MHLKALFLAMLLLALAFTAIGSPVNLDEMAVATPIGTGASSMAVPTGSSDTGTSTTNAECTFGAKRCGSIENTCAYCIIEVCNSAGQWQLNNKCDTWHWDTCKEFNGVPYCGHW